MSELGDLLELMYGAHGRWHTARLVVRDWTHSERARAAFERRLAETEKQGGNTLRVSVSARGSREPRPETTEQVTRIWLDGDRSRIEQDRAEGKTVVVHDGATWWRISRDDLPTTNDGNPVQHADRGDDIKLMLDPAPLLGELDLEPRGAREVAGRPGIAVRAVARPRQRGLPFLWQLQGGDEIELVIDEDLGIVLSTTSFIGGEPYHSREFLEVAFDETFGPETFRIELPPGESFQSAGRRYGEHVSIEEAVQRASFSLFVPARLGRGWELRHASYFSPSERPVRVESVHLMYRHETGTHKFQLVETMETQPWLDTAELRTIEREGIVMRVFDPNDEGFAVQRHVLVERDGTHVNVTSQDLPVEELIEIAVSLVPAPDSPPPAVER